MAGAAPAGRDPSKARNRRAAEGRARERERERRGDVSDVCPAARHVHEEEGTCSTRRRKTEEIQSSGLDSGLDQLIESSIIGACIDRSINRSIESSIICACIDRSTQAIDRIIHRVRLYQIHPFHPCRRSINRLIESSIICTCIRSVHVIHHLCALHTWYVLGSRCSTISVLGDGGEGSQQSMVWRAHRRQIAFDVSW